MFLLFTVVPYLSTILWFCLFVSFFPFCHLHLLHFSCYLSTQFCPFVLSVHQSPFLSHFTSVIFPICFCPPNSFLSFYLYLIAVFFHFVILCQQNGAFLNSTNYDILFRLRVYKCLPGPYISLACYSVFSHCLHFLSHTQGLPIPSSLCLYILSSRSLSSFFSLFSYVPFFPSVAPPPLFLPIISLDVFPFSVHQICSLSILLSFLRPSCCS